MKKLLLLSAVLATVAMLFPLWANSSFAGNCKYSTAQHPCIVR
jgi:hypothetical protein